MAEDNFSYTVTNKYGRTFTRTVSKTKKRTKSGKKVTTSTVSDSNTPVATIRESNGKTQLEKAAPQSNIDQEQLAEVQASNNVSPERPEVINQLRQTQSRATPEQLARIRKENNQPTQTTTNNNIPPPTITAEVKPKGIERVRYEIEKAEGKLLTQEQRRSSRGQTSFAQGAALVGLGVVRGVYNTGELAYNVATDPLYLSKSVWNFGAATVKDPSTPLNVIAGAGQSFTQNPGGFVGEVIGSGGLIEGTVRGVSAIDRSVTAARSAKAINQKYKNAIIEKPESFVTRVSKDVSVEGTPVTGAKYIGTREQLQGFTRENSMLNPTYGPMVDLRTLKNPQVVVARGNIAQEITKIIPTNKPGIIPKPSNAEITKVRTQVIQTKDIPTQTTVFKSNLRTGEDLGFKIREVGTVSYESLVTPTTKTSQAFKLLTQNNKAALTQSTQKSVAPFIKENIGAVDITVSGKRTTLLYDVNTFQPLAEVVKSSNVVKVAGAKPDIKNIVKDSFLSGNNPVTSTFTSTSVASGNQILLQKQEQVTKTTAVASGQTTQSVSKQSSENLVIASAKKKSSSASSQEVFKTSTQTTTRPRSSSSAAATSSLSKQSNRITVAIAKGNRFASLNAAAKDKSLANLNKNILEQNKAVSQSLAQSRATSTSQASSLANSLASAKVSISSTRILNEKLAARKAAAGRIGFPAAITNINKDLERQTFLGQVKTRQGFRTVSVGGIANALSATSRIIDTSPLASARIINRDTGEVVGDRELFGKRFRSSKARAGVFVEKNKFRIDTPGEISGISRKGGKKKRRVNKWLI